MMFVQHCATSTLSSAAVTATSELSTHLFLPPVQDDNLSCIDDTSHVICDSYVIHLLMRLLMTKLIIT